MRTARRGNISDRDELRDLIAEFLWLELDLILKREQISVVYPPGTTEVLAKMEPYSEPWKKLVFDQLSGHYLRCPWPEKTLDQEYYAKALQMKVK